MPKRPRQHELEDLSRRAFTSAIPARFVFEDRTNDYGIDGSVELFRDGETTGELFDVQLKGTDRVLAAALKVYIPHDHAQYYRSLDRPVLMVRYHASTETLYVRWFHSFDPHYGGVNKKTITFTWAEEHLWSETAADRLEAEVGAFRRFRSAALDLPVRFRLQIEEDQLHGVSRDGLAQMIRSSLNPEAAGLIEVVDNDEHLPVVRLMADLSVIDLQTVTTATLEHEEGGPEKNLDRFPFDIGLGMALAFDQVGHADLAARLAVRAAGRAAIIEAPDVLFWIVGVLARTHRIREALDLADGLAQREESGPVASSEIVRLLPALMARQPLTDAERAAQVSALEQQADASDAIGDWKAGRTAHYNLARQLREEDPGQSLHHFFEAVRCDSGYLNRDYFCKELAALFFLNGHYDFAIHFYERAIELGAGGITPLLLGDALLFGGHYRQAYDTFATAIEATDDVPMEFYLKFRATGWIMSALKVQQQQRDVEVAEELAMRARPDTAPDERTRLCLEALSEDALCGPAWHTLGVIFHSEDEIAQAFRAFIISCIIEPWNVTPWTNAIVSVPPGESEEEQQLGRLAGVVVAAAHRRHGDRLEAALRAIMTGKDEAAKDRMMDEFRALIDPIAEEEQDELELRFLSEEGDSYDLIRIPHP